VWEQHPQIEDALPASPYDSTGAPAGVYLGTAGGDAFKFKKQSYIISK
jgi:hypothetical protein